MNKLVRSYAALVETLDKHRGKGQQVVRVEHVTVNAGGQAIVGAVSQTEGMGRPAQEQPERLEAWERSGEMLQLRRQESELLSETRELVEKVR